MPVSAARGLEGRLGYTITVPDSWYEVDCEPATRGDAIRRLVEDRVRGTDELWEQRHAIAQVLLEQASRAHEAGATYCAGFAMPTPEGTVSGSVTVSLVMNAQRQAGGGAVDLRGSFVQVPRDPDDPTEPYAVTSVVDVPGIGDSPRSSGIEDAQLGDGHFLRNVFMITAVPVDDVDRVFLVALSSPVIALADPLLDLFDAVTSTFRVVRIDADELQGEPA
jgi:hypothetical protein